MALNKWRNCLVEDLVVCKKPIFAFIDIKFLQKFLKSAPLFICNRATKPLKKDSHIIDTFVLSLVSSWR